MATAQAEPVEATHTRVVGVLSALYFVKHIDEITRKPAQRVLTGTFGQEIELGEQEERRLDQNGALLPAGSSREDAMRRHDAALDAYRAQRGDKEAMDRHHERLSAAGDGGIVNIDAHVEGSSIGDLAAWMRDTKPNAEDTVALAEADPVKAAKVLAAEEQATGQNPRSTVAQRLQKIIDG